MKIVREKITVGECAGSVTKVCLFAELRRTLCQALLSPPDEARGGTGTMVCHPCGMLGTAASHLCLSPARRLVTDGARAARQMGEYLPRGMPLAREAPPPWRHEEWMG